MLARTQWDKPSLDDFITWLEGKPPGEEYEWIQPRYCACAQYAASIGMPWYSWAHEAWGRDSDGLWWRLNGLARGRPWTFGALLERALRYRMERGDDQGLSVDQHYLCGAAAEQELSFSDEGVG